MYLQVLKVPDIADGTGLYLTPAAVLQGLCFFDRKSQYSWPPQECPSTIAWRLWQHTLTHVFSTAPTTSMSCLRQKLGRWLSPADHHQKCTFYMDTDTMTLIKCTNSRTHGMGPIPNRRHSFLHGATEEEQGRILKQKVDQVLTVFYADKDNASVTDCSLFLLPCRVSIQRHNRNVMDSNSESLTPSMKSGTSVIFRRWSLAPPRTTL